MKRLEAGLKAAAAAALAVCAATSCAPKEFVFVDAESGGSGGAPYVPIECAKEYTNITGDCDLLNQNCEFKDKYFCEVKTAADSVSTICKGKHGGLLPQGADCNPQEKDTCKAGLRCVFKNAAPTAAPPTICPATVGFAMCTSASARAMTG